jgi:hypothetical protein
MIGLLVEPIDQEFPAAAKSPEPEFGTVDRKTLWKQSEESHYLNNVEQGFVHPDSYSSKDRKG